MAEAVVSGVVTRIGDLLVQEGKFLSGVSNQVELLKTELNLMQGLLKDADARQDESDAVRRWVAETRDLAYDADDIIATYALTVGSRKGGSVQKFIKRCSCILHEGIAVHQVGSKIDDIKKRISHLKQSFQEYGMKIESTTQAGGPSSSNESQRNERQTFYHLKDDPVGFDDDLKTLVEFMLTEKEGNTSVASICGMGGLGKTTLAQMVYNHPTVMQHFHSRAWVHISQQCQRRPVWEEILILLRSPSPKERHQIGKKNDAEIVEELIKFQKARKCLVILDDIWHVETWDKLNEAFPIKDTNSKILLTSRNKQVPLYVDPRGFLYELQCRNEERSQELLEKIAISWREDSVTKTDMKKIGKEMIDYCGGLPLAITVLGGLLATKETPDQWENVLEHVKSYLCGEQGLLVKKVLALSYDDLPSHLKSCFLYLGHFPEDEIPTKEVIRMWMGEGFISQIQHERRREDRMEEYVGKRYIEELVQRFMVQVGKRGSLGKIKTCRIHDLMRDFCLFKVQEENFLHITDVFSMKQHEALNHKVRRLSIIRESGDNSSEEMSFNKYPYLRSILHLLPHYDDYTYFKGSCFKKLKFVRVLHLENFKNVNGKLPKDIGCLIHLRYLSLKKSYINKVPSFIGNLRCLETLDLRSDCMTVPNVFKNMEQLKHLYLPYDYWVCPPWAKLELGNLCYLQTLVNVQPLNIQIPTGLKFNDLRVLKVRTNNQVLKVRTNKRAQDATQRLVSCCPHIYKLSLCVSVKNLPDQLSPNIAKLTLLETCLKEDPMATLEKLPKLKILHLKDAFKGKNMVCSKTGFPRLQSLFLSFLSNLEEWRVEEGAMPVLCHLEIQSCCRLNTIPDQLSPNIAKLTLLETCLKEDPMATLEKLPKLKILHLNDAFKGKNMVCSKTGFPQLQSLFLSYLSNLEEWRVEEGAMPVLCHLEIQSCCRLNTIPDQLSPNIAKLTLLETCLKEDPMATLEKLPKLKILHLNDAFKGKNMVCSKTGFPQLQSLFLSYLSNLEEWRVEEGAMPVLCHLEIQSCCRLNTIPDGLRHAKVIKDRLGKGGSDFDKVKHVPSLVFQGSDYEW